MTVTIYHNPGCGTSRNTLAMIRACGVEPAVIEYLVDPPSRAELVALLQRMKARPRDILRQKGTPYDELGLGDERLSDEELIDAMMAHPILINRPIVVTAMGVRLCRPSEVVLEILADAEAVGQFTKEDGEVVSARVAGKASTSPVGEAKAQDGSGLAGSETKAKKHGAARSAR